MNSIGNDIVDLHFIDKERTQSAPFYSKILSAAEQAFYQSHFTKIPFWQYVWLLWSCKEAVYKFEKRLQPGLMFSPVRICLEPDFLSESEFTEFENEPNLDTHCKSYKFFYSKNLSSDIICNTSIVDNYLHTVAYSTSDTNNIISNVERIDNPDYESQSAAVRSLLSEKLASVLPDPVITFKKSPAGYPIILNHGTDTGIVASFAHHGNYVAYAFNRE